EGEVRDGDSALLTAQTGEGVELLQVDVVHAGLFDKLASGGLAQRFVFTQETAGKRPHALVGLPAAVDQQNLQLLLADGEDDDQDGDSHKASIRGAQQA